MLLPVDVRSCSLTFASADIRTEDKGLLPGCGRHTLFSEEGSKKICFVLLLLLLLLLVTFRPSLLGIGKKISLVF